MAFRRSGSSARGGSRLSALTDESFIEDNEHEEEVKKYAEHIGLDLVNDSELLWIAEFGIDAPVPEPWTSHVDDNGQMYYFNMETAQSAWNHPLDEKFKDVVAKIKHAQNSSETSADLESRVQQLQAVNASLSAELQTVSASVEHERRGRENDKAAHESAVAVLKQASVDAVKNLAQQRDEVNILRQRCTELEMANSGQQASAETTVQHLHEQLASKQKTISVLEEELSNKQNIVQAVRSDLSQSIQTVADLRTSKASEVAKLETDLANMESKWRTADSQAKSLERKLSSLKLQMNSQESNRTELLADAENQLAKVENERAELENALEQMSEKAASHAHDVTSVKQLNAELNTEVQTLRSNLKQAESALLAVQSDKARENESQIKTVKQLEVELQQSKQEFQAELQRNLTEAQAQLTAAQSSCQQELNQQLELNARMRQQLKAAQEEAESLHNSLTKAQEGTDSSMKEMQQQLVESRGKVESFRAEIDSLHKQHSQSHMELSKSLKSAQSQIEGLQSRLAETSRNLTETKELLNEQVSETNIWKTKFEDLESSSKLQTQQLEFRLHNAETSLESGNKRVHELLSQLDAKAENITALEEDNIRLQTSAEEAAAEAARRQSSEKKELFNEQMELLSKQQSLENELSQWKARSEDWERSATELRETLNRQNVKIQELSEQNGLISSELAKTMQQYQQQESQNKKESDERKGEITRLKSSFEKLEKSLLQSKQETKEAIEEAQRAAIHGTKASDVVSTLQDKISSLESALEAKEDMLEALKGSNDEITRRCHFWEDTAGTRASEKEVAERQLQGLQAFVGKRIQEAQDTVSQERQAAAAVKQDNAAKAAKIAELKTTIETLRNRFSAAKSLFEGGGVPFPSQSLEAAIVEKTPESTRHKDSHKGVSSPMFTIEEMIARAASNKPGGTQRFKPPPPPESVSSSEGANRAFGSGAGFGRARGQYIAREPAPLPGAGGRPSTSGSATYGRGKGRGQGLPMPYGTAAPPPGQPSSHPKGIRALGVSSGGADPSARLPPHQVVGTLLNVHTPGAHGTNAPVQPRRLAPMQSPSELHKHNNSGMQAHTLPVHLSPDNQDGANNVDHDDLGPSASGVPMRKSLVQRKDLPIAGKNANLGQEFAGTIASGQLELQTGPVPLPQESPPKQFRPSGSTREDDDGQSRASEDMYDDAPEGIGNMSAIVPGSIRGQHVSSQKKSGTCALQ